MRWQREKSVYSTRYLGSCLRPVAANWTLVGQDGGQSIPVGDRTLFVFSDTLLAVRDEDHAHHPAPPAFRDLVGGGDFLANAGGLTENSDLRKAWASIRYFEDAGGVMREILPATDWERSRGIRFWPEHGVYLDGLVYLYYLGIQTTDPSTIWGFHTIGSGLAVLDPASGSCERCLFDGAWRGWRVWGDDSHFGVQALVVNDDVFVFASVRDGLYWRARLARVKATRIDQPESYRYLRSRRPSWTQAAEDACDLGPCGGDYSVSFNPYLGKYVMFYVDEYEKILLMRTASALWGPYSDPAAVVGLPHEATSEMVYLGFEHPGFAKDGGRTIHVSYCQPRFRNNCLLAVTFH